MSPFRSLISTLMIHPYKEVGGICNGGMSLQTQCAFASTGAYKDGLALREK